jgi:mono/diheme cytochrome c family protein
MYPKSPDLADPAVQRLSDGELFCIIQNGVRWTGMPAWKHDHSTEETWRLVSFIRALPTLTRTDLEGVGLATGEQGQHRDHEHSTETNAEPKD